MGFADDMIGSLKKNRGLQTKNRGRSYWQNEPTKSEGSYSFKPSEKLTATERMEMKKNIWQVAIRRRNMKIGVIILSILATLCLVLL